MWYAIEYAYGRNIINNGQRADNVYEFTARRLRDAWIACGPPDMNASGYREKASARDPLVRKANWKDDGDRVGWRAIAEQRIDQSMPLQRYKATINADWPETDHYRWVATAPESEIIGWARATENNI